MIDTMLWIAGAYLLGSIPTGLLLGKLYGIDVRQQGSGNIGATNLYRTVGRRVGGITLLGDCLKGLLPVLLAWKLGMGEPMQAWIGLAAFCGHVFSIFLLFKGGKGVATALGVYLALAPLAVLGALLVFIILVAIWRYISLGSVVAAAVMPVVIWFRPHSPELLIATALISIIVIAKHHANIKRLLEGSESKFKA
ncbi:MAG: glycerol-3-phosphate 1-O-acyltransferase PlsY [Trichlorobacter sp.]